MNKPHVFYMFETAVGLGHQRRASGIVNGLVRAGFDVTVASGSFVGAEHFFDPQAKLLELPVNHRSKNGVSCYYDKDNNLVEDPDFNHEAWMRQRMEVVMPLFDRTQIDCIMTEWWPFDREKQFGPLVRGAIAVQQERFGYRPLLISSVRDDPKTGGTSGTLAHKEAKTVEVINRMVDAVLVHGDPHLVRLEDSFAAHADIKKPVLYTGYVVNDAAKAQAYEREKTVMVSCGSGDEGQHFLKRVVEARKHLNVMGDYEWHFIMGPRMDHDHKAQFRNAAAQTTMRNTIVHEELPHLPELMGSAGFSLSLAGYNTTIEVMSSGVPSVLVPKFIETNGELSKTDQEQWGRLVRLRDKGLAFIAHPDEVRHAEGFARLIETAYATGRTPFTLDTNGAKKTASLVAELVWQHRAQAVRPFLMLTQQPLIAVAGGGMPQVQEAAAAAL